MIIFIGLTKVNRLTIMKMHLGRHMPTLTAVILHILIDHRICTVAQMIENQLTTLPSTRKCSLFKLWLEMCFVELNRIYTVVLNTDTINLKLSTCSCKQSLHHRGFATSGQNTHTCIQINLYHTFIDKPILYQSISDHYQFIYISTI